jgi:hypothetical protein
VKLKIHHAHHREKKTMIKILDLLSDSFGGGNLILNANERTKKGTAPEQLTFFFDQHRYKSIVIISESIVTTRFERPSLSATLPQIKKRA